MIDTDEENSWHCTGGHCIRGGPGHEGKCMDGYGAWWVGRRCPACHAGGSCAGHADLLNDVASLLRDAVGGAGLPRWEDIPGALAGVVAERNADREALAAVRVALPDDLAVEGGTLGERVYTLVVSRNSAIADCRAARDERDGLRARVSALEAADLDVIDTWKSVGFSAALDEVDAQMAFTVDWPADERIVDMAGWIRGRRAGL